MRILLIEDDQKTAAYLKKGLSQNGFSVIAASRGEEGLYLASSMPHDLIILDIMLPDRNGWAVLSNLRKADNRSPILLVTACGAIQDRVKGLKLGADDYIVKPFAFSELLARIHAVLRRGAPRQRDVIRVGNLEIHLLQHRVLRNGKAIDLTAKEFLLLSLLARHAGDVLSRTVIAEQVWDINFDCDSNVVDVAIRRLRKKIDDPFSNPLIHTIRGRGYVLEERCASKKTA